MKRKYYGFILPAVTVLILDQITKQIIVARIGYYETITVISGFFNIVHVRNRGMAFGLLNRAEPGFFFYLLAAATIGAVLLIIFWFIRLKEEEKGMTIGLSLILGGAVGNLIDRMVFAEVIDFLDFHIGSYHWPAFNIADSAITAGTFWVVIFILFFGPKEEGKQHKET